MRREAGRKLMQVAEQVHAAGIEPMSDDEIVAEVKAVRAERPSGLRARPRLRSVSHLTIDGASGFCAFPHEGSDVAAGHSQLGVIGGPEAALQVLGARGGNHDIAFGKDVQST